jgi:hypothetical protein
VAVAKSRHANSIWCFVMRTPLAFELIAAPVLLVSCRHESSFITYLLRQGVPIVRKLKPGATHSYRFVISKGYLCEIRADQIGIELILRMSVAGTSTYEIDRWSSPGSFETADIIADQDISPPLDIVSGNADGLPGKYRLSITTCPVATDRDRPQNRKTHRDLRGVHDRAGVPR